MANSSLSAASGSKAGGSQLSEERRERSERASSYDPVFSLGRCAMSRPRDPGISADIPGSPPDNTLIHRFKRQGRASGKSVSFGVSTGGVRAVRPHPAPEPEPVARVDPTA